MKQSHYNLQATREKEDLDIAEQLWNAFGGYNITNDEISWDNKWSSTHLLLFELTQNVRLHFSLS